MTTNRYLKITVKSTVGVYLPTDSLADRVSSKKALLTRLRDTGNWHSDGRANFCVEQLHAAAETIVKDAIEKLIEDHLRNEDEFLPLRTGGSNKKQKKFEKCFALAAFPVMVHETPTTNEHVLEFEIEEP